MLNEIVNFLNGWESKNGFQLSASLEGDSIVIEESDSDQVMSLTQDGEQLICMTTAIRSDEVAPEKVSELHDFMLSMSLPMPLSSFGKMGDEYVIFGAMHSDTTLNNVAEEVETLLLNAEAMADELTQFKGA